MPSDMAAHKIDELGDRAAELFFQWTWMATETDIYFK